MRSPQAMSLAGQDISQGTRGVGSTIASLSQARVPRPTERAPRDGALWVGRRAALRSRLVGLFRARRFQKPISPDLSLSQARVPRPTERAPRDGALWVGRRTALRSRLVGLFRARRFQKPID